MTEHTDRRELGYGNVDARPAMDGNNAFDGGVSTPSVGGGESGGGSRPEPVENNGGKGPPGGQTDPAYRGGDNPNSTRTGDGGDAQ